MRALFMALGVLILMSGFAYAQGTTKLGVIDLQRVIRDSKAGKAAKSAFESEFQRKKQIIESKQSQLESLRRDFIQNAPVMNDTTRKQKAEQIDKLDKDLNRTRQDFRDDLQRKDLELTQQILQDLESILQNIGQTDGYTMIVEVTEGGVVYANTAIDVTPKVIQAYDAKK